MLRIRGELGREGLPRAIAAEQLENMLGSSEAFCSWDACNANINEMIDCWPFLFSHPLMGAAATPKEGRA